MGFSLNILGCGSATPTVFSNPTSQHLVMREKHFLIDCGEGSQIELRRMKIRFNRINHIFISHLHGDHWFGLPGLLSSFHLLNRSKELHLYAPSGLKSVLSLTFRLSNTWLKFPIVFHELKEGLAEEIFSDDTLSITAFPLKHSVPTWGFRFQEKEAERNLNVEAAQALQVPVYWFKRIKQGADWESESGELHINSSLTLDPPKPKSYAFCSDTAYSEQICEFIKGVDLLYHEATFLEIDRHLADKTLHSTATDAARIAALAQVQDLLLGHFSVRYKNRNAMLEEALPFFNSVRLAADGLTLRYF
jgi:ribonuclease Z